MIVNEILLAAVIAAIVFLLAVVREPRFARYFAALLLTRACAVEAARQAWSAARASTPCLSRPRIPPSNRSQFLPHPRTMILVSADKSTIAAHAPLGGVRGARSLLFLMAAIVKATFPDRSERRWRLMSTYLLLSGSSHPTRADWTVIDRELAK